MNDRLRKHRILKVDELARYFFLSRSTVHRIIRTYNFNLKSPTGILGLVSFLVKRYTQNLK